MSNRKTAKILHIDTERGWRGGQNQVRLLCEGLREAGHEPHLVALQDSPLWTKLKDIAGVRLNSGRGFQPRTALKLARYCDQNSIRIIHAHSSHAHDLGLLIKMLRPKLKLIVHRRVDYPPADNLLSRFKYQGTLVDRYVCVSKAISGVLYQSGIAKQKLRVVYSAVEMPRIPSVAEGELKRTILHGVGGDPSQPLIVNVAALTHQKGHETLLRALALLQKQGVAFNCVIAGEGELRKSLERLRDQLELNASTFFLGFRDDVPAVIAAADLFVMPSNDEGLGTTLLDAALQKKCIVATAVGGIPEIIEDKKTGLLCKRGDIAAFAQAIQVCLIDHQLRADYAEKLRAFVVQNFSVEEMVSGNLGVYAELL